MASAKQIAWRKKFARMSKAGKFKKSKKSKSSSNPHGKITDAEFDKIISETPAIVELEKKLKKQRAKVSGAGGFAFKDQDRYTAMRAKFEKRLRALAKKHHYDLSWERELHYIHA